MTNTIRGLLAVALLAVATGCSGPPPAKCPAFFDPSHFTKAQLELNGLTSMPEQGSTGLENVQWTAENRKAFFKTNYPDVVSVQVGDGWGVTYSNDQFGNTTYHHLKDYMVVALVKRKSACPNPTRGTLFLIGQDQTRVPVRFSYESSG